MNTSEQRLQVLYNMLRQLELSMKKPKGNKYYCIILRRAIFKKSDNDAFVTVIYLV